MERFLFRLSSWLSVPPLMQLSQKAVRCIGMSRACRVHGGCRASTEHARNTWFLECRTLVSFHRQCRRLTGNDLQQDLSLTFIR